MPDYAWRIKHKGNENLGCLIKKHHMCESDCPTCFPSHQMGHCYGCEMIVVYSTDTTLERLAVYGPQGIYDTH